MTNLNLSDVRIFLCTTPTKMSYSFDTLMGQAQKVFDQDPLSGHLFLFFNRDRNRVKILFWDHDGFCIWYKRLERLQLRWHARRTATHCSPRFCTRMIHARLRKSRWTMTAPAEGVTKKRCDAGPCLGVSVRSPPAVAGVLKLLACDHRPFCIRGIVNRHRNGREVSARLHEVSLGSRFFH